MDRRSFVRSLAGIGGAALASGYASPLAALAGMPLDPKDQIGLQLFTVRDLTAKDYAGTLLSVGRIGYREVQTTGSYGELTPGQIRQFLDAAGLRSPATHVNPRVGADFEKTLEGHQLIGHRYSTVALAGSARGGAGGAGGPRPGAAPAAAAQGAPRQRGTGGAARVPQTLDSVKRTAEQLNEAGRVTQRYGIKVIVHNHTEEFEPLADSSQRPYDVLLAETDPSLVAMELDIGWAAVAGQDALELFRQHPGRFEVWHVKDISGMATLGGLEIAERRRAAKIVPMGMGDLDYRSIFAQAELAGMKHYFVEQDTAPQSGDSMAAAATSYQNLLRILS